MNTPVLEGYGVRLEPVSEGHTAALQTIATDTSIWHYMNLRITNLADVHEWVQDSVRLNATDDAQIWVACLANGEVVGSSRLFDLQRKHRTGEVGFTWLAAPYRGRGINPRVKLLQLTHAFETLGLRRVALKTHHDNVPSQRAMLKLGAQYEGTFRNHMIMPDGSTRHTVWFSIVADEWPAVKAGLIARIAAEPLPAASDAPDVQSKDG